MKQSEMVALLDAFEETSFDAGADVIAQGAEGTHFYVVKAGALSVAKDGTQIATLGAGDYVGERSLLTGEATAATVTASENSTLFALSKSQFETLLGPMQGLLDRERKRRDAEAERAAAPSIKWDDLQVMVLLGEGSFGRVKLTLHQPSGATYALKCLRKGQLLRYQQVEHVVNEKRVLALCDHPFILKLAGTFNRETEIFMLLEVALGGELFTYLRQQTRFDEEQACLYAAMVTAAFGYLHERKIAHRDLKPENLLFDRDGYLKLVDFGFAKVIRDRTWTLCGTPEYLAPEIISNKGHNIGADWWTLGILLYEMLVGHPPFVAENQMETYHKIMRGKYKMPANFPRPAKAILSQFLTHNPAGRLGCWKGGTRDVTTHEFFRAIAWNDLEAKKIKMAYVPKITNPLDTSNFDDYPDADPDAHTWDKYVDASYETIWASEFGS